MELTYFERLQYYATIEELNNILDIKTKIYV